MDAVDRMQASEELLRARINEAAGSIPAARACRPGSRQCEGCGRAIPAKRLRALPGARLCIGCQRESEEGRPF